MPNTNTHGIKTLNAITHTRDLLVFRRDAEIDMPDPVGSQGVVYQLLAHRCTLTLRALGKATFYGDFASVTVQGGPVLILSDGQQYEVVEPEATVALDEPKEQPDGLRQGNYETKLAECKLIKEVDALEKEACGVAGVRSEQWKAMAETRREAIRK